MQSVPCPPSSAPPAPPSAPPPENPPPPPHENNQPLYAPFQPAPVPAPTSASSAAHASASAPDPARVANPSNFNSVNITPGNAHTQWSYDAKEQHAATDTEALKKLAEEEKLFDIQFQKWEEEIDKWRKENVNHPDKEAYKEYEAKFEACRAQLLERRQQMKQKRARLLSNTPAGPGSGNKPPAVPPPFKNPAGSSYSQNQPHGQNDRQDYRNQSQGYQNKQDQKYSNQSQNASYQQYNDPSRYSRTNRDSIDPRDRYESYEDVDNHSTNDYQPDNSSFLPTSGTSKSIPGLDLVPETEKTVPNVQDDVIEIPDDHNAEKNQQLKGPDYSTISKGINNILGDEKIMNILSSLQGGQNAPESNTNENTSYNNYNNQNVPPNNLWNRNNNLNNQQFGNRQNNMPYHNRQDQNNSMPQHHSMQQNYPVQQHHSMQQINQMQQNYPVQQNRPGHQNHPMHQNRPGQHNNLMHQNHAMQPNQDQNKFPPQQDLFNSRNSQYGGPNMPQRNDQGPNQNPTAPRPLLDLPVQPPPNFQRAPPNRDIHPNILQNAPPPPPQRPKWVEEPLFTPSFIVEYEHKPLRLKGN